MVVLEVMGTGAGYFESTAWADHQDVAGFFRSGRG
jgi:hypothetical protein